jgi:hypothetical protein
MKTISKQQVIAQSQMNTKTEEKSLLYPIFVAADTRTGVYKINHNDYDDLELMPIALFTSSLATLSDDDEPIFTVFRPENEKEYQKLNEEYGIR